MHGDGTDFIIGDIDDDPPLLHVGIGDALFDVVDRRGRHLGSPEVGKAFLACLAMNSRGRSASASLARRAMLLAKRASFVISGTPTAGI